MLFIYAWFEGSDIAGNIRNPLDKFVLQYFIFIYIFL